MWQRHWSLARDPFDEGRATFVATPAHAEAMARLVHVIESVGRSARLVAGAGLGKSTVVARAIEATRSPTRRFARASGRADGTGLLVDLASGLGVRVAPDASRGMAWRALAEAARLARWQRVHVVIVVEDCQAIDDPAGQLDLDRLEHLDPDPSARITVIRIGRPTGIDDSSPDPARWDLAIRLTSLTRSESAGYLDAKLGAVGRQAPTFTQKALTRLHALAGGIPRGLDRLASLALMAGAVRGLDIVSPEIVEASAREYLPDADFAMMG